jgi:hypothetical protein
MVACRIEKSKATAFENEIWTFNLLVLIVSKMG